MVQLTTQAQKHQALQKAITEGLKSGISQRSVADIIKEAKAELKALTARSTDCCMLKSNTRIQTAEH